VRILALTGSIGMGKSATLAMFAEAGVPVYDADAEVHRLYERGGAAVGPVGEAFPGVVVDGAIDRQILGAQVLADNVKLQRLQGIVYPLMAGKREAFLEQAKASGAPFAVLDIPLLFETGGEESVDAVAVVSAPADLQRARVLARPGMTEAKFASILAKQTPDAEKRRRADYVIDSSQGLEAARAQVAKIVAAMRDPQWRRPRDA
jgi:dephospho-CoA kinase